LPSIRNLINTKVEKSKLKSEGLVPYWEAIRQDPDKQIMIGREIHFRQKYEGFITYTEDQFEKL